MKCNECGKNMLKVDRRLEMAELDENATEGQIADYFAAELSGDMGAWRMGIVEYKCGECGTTLEMIDDSLENYNALIIGWHNKAKRGDYFSKYIFEYLAFTAYLKSRVDLDSSTDRATIQKLKRDERLKKEYLDRIKNDTEFDLQGTWIALIEELERQPLHNSSRDYDYPEIDGWWNTSGGRIEESKIEEGVIHSLNDWENMIEFWYGVRNNLFHGGKDPNLKRDLFLVEHAFKTLNAFMKIRITEILRNESGHS